VSVGHAAGEGPLDGFQIGLSTAGRHVIDWVTDVEVRIAIGSKAQPTFDVGRTNDKKLGPSEGGTVVKLHREPMQKFHEATQVGVVALLVRHDPTGGVGVVVKLMLRGLLKKKYQKRSCCEKKNKRKQI